MSTSASATAGPSSGPPAARTVRLPSDTVQNLHDASRIVLSSLENARPDLLNVANTPENVVRSFTTLIQTILDLPLASVDEELQNRINHLTRSVASLAAEGRLEDGEVSPFRAECTARLE